jgi:hypothetical protein
VTPIKSGFLSRHGAEIKGIENQNGDNVAHKLRECELPGDAISGRRVRVAHKLREPQREKGFAFV